MKPFYPETGAVDRIDDYTAQFNLLEPNAFFPGALTGQLGYVSSPTWIAAALDDPTLNQKPVGTGPFVFDSRSPDSVTRFVRNDSWWNGEVYLDAVEFVPVPDADTRAELLLEGDINALQTSDPGAILKLDEDSSVQQVKDETSEEGFAMMNSGCAAVRRHPGPPGAHPRHPGGELPQPHRARRVAPRLAAVHPREQVLQPGRDHAHGRPGGRQGALRRVLR